jgi:hypothetical protein
MAGFVVFWGIIITTATRSVKLPLIEVNSTEVALLPNVCEAMGSYVLGMIAPRL